MYLCNKKQNKNFTWKSIEFLKKSSKWFLRVKNICCYCCCATKWALRRRNEKIVVDDDDDDDDVKVSTAWMLMMSCFTLITKTRTKTKNLLNIRICRAVIIRHSWTYFLCWHHEIYIQNGNENRKRKKLCNKKKPRKDYLWVCNKN